MIDDHVIYCPYGYVPPPEDMATRYKPLAGIVVVRPLDDTIVGGIYTVQEQFGSKIQRDAGHVLAVGAGVPLEVGDLVCYRAGDGYFLDRRTRMFGMGCPWYDQIVGKVSPLGEFECTGDWALVECEPHAHILAQLSEIYQSRGRVLSVGPDADQTLLGKTVELRKYIQLDGGIIDHSRQLDFKGGFSKPSWDLRPASELIAEYVCAEN